ncbi:hypothetical protein SAMN05216464_107122 [Mucilaginibacter pineti]|uniref:Uncharacterized protein n=1 Tax=Mucilaginibacter pineti TaxID=1391627 RepID=A0A1G7DU09_9SPHI|nr:hypothetical protein [Mucilaginibacter pineti]SDE54941.1 hypothetical protein SAMN05216464_107122 [Mucilaginibacter pineti]
MTIQEQIYNWLVAGLQQSPVKFSEVFYYDRRDNQFFSILMTDYFLFESDGELAKDAISTYSASTLKQLKDRVGRINIDTDIIALPRLGDTEDDYLPQADNFLNLNAINIDETTIWEVEESGSITLKIE